MVGDGWQTDGLGADGRMCGMSGWSVNELMDGYWVN